MPQKPEPKSKVFPSLYGLYKSFQLLPIVSLVAEMGCTKLFSIATSRNDLCTIFISIAISIANATNGLCKIYTPETLVQINSFSTLIWPVQNFLTVANSIAVAPYALYRIFLTMLTALLLAEMTYILFY